MKGNLECAVKKRKEKENSILKKDDNKQFKCYHESLISEN